ncbi:hypothetical protein GCM10010359_32670 [Streptomyces morookaense]|nr:hypothetical protein GCM10010359_32670 [Streptomyces morookaense]
MRPHGADRPARRILLPQLVDEQIDVHDLARPEQQQRHHLVDHGASQGLRDPARCDAKRSQHREERPVSHCCAHPRELVVLVRTDAHGSESKHGETLQTVALLRKERMPEPKETSEQKVET